MAKAYICDKCGKPFDHKDRLRNANGSIVRYGYPMIVKFTTDLHYKKRHRCWDEFVFCAECSCGIAKFMRIFEE